MAIIILVVKIKIAVSMPKAMFKGARLLLCGEKWASDEQIQGFLVRE
jgi:hypothetical protein